MSRLVIFRFSLPFSPDSHAVYQGLWGCDSTSEVCSMMTQKLSVVNSYAHHHCCHSTKGNNCWSSSLVIWILYSYENFKLCLSCQLLLSFWILSNSF